jgi:hypothetical protein
VRRDWRGVRNWSSWFAGGSRIWGPGDGRYGTPSRETRGRRGGLLASVGAYYSVRTKDFDESRRRRWLAVQLCAVRLRLRLRLRG